MQSVDPEEQPYRPRRRGQSESGVSGGVEQPAGGDGRAAADARSSAPPAVLAADFTTWWAVHRIGMSGKGHPGVLGAQQQERVRRVAEREEAEHGQQAAQPGRGGLRPRRDPPAPQRRGSQAARPSAPRARRRRARARRPGRAPRPGRDRPQVRCRNRRADATSGPTTAPAWSIARWNPKARPRSSGGVTWARSASRGAPRPLPMRSTMRHGQDVPGGRGRRHQRSCDRRGVYPATISGLRRRMRSETRPETTLARLANDSARPSTSPTNGTRPEHAGEERWQQRIDHLAAGVREQTDQPQTPDGGGKSRHSGRTLADQ